jgi:hypothetical protein
MFGVALFFVIKVSQSVKEHLFQIMGSTEIVMSVCQSVGLSVCLLFLSRHSTEIDIILSISLLLYSGLKYGL